MTDVEEVLVDQGAMPRAPNPRTTLAPTERIPPNGKVVKRSSRPPLRLRAFPFAIHLLPPTADLKPMFRNSRYLTRGPLPLV